MQDEHYAWLSEQLKNLKRAIEMHPPESDEVIMLQDEQRIVEEIFQALEGIWR